MQAVPQGNQGQHLLQRCSGARKRQRQTREAGENTAASTAAHTDTTQSTSIKLEEATKTNCRWGTAAATSPPSCRKEQPLAAPFMKHAEQDGDGKLSLTGAELRGGLFRLPHRSISRHILLIDGLYGYFRSDDVSWFGSYCTIPLYHSEDFTFEFLIELKSSWTSINQKKMNATFRGQSMISSWEQIHWAKAEWHTG